MEAPCLCTFGVAREYKNSLKVELLFSSVLFSFSNATHKLEHWQWPPQRAFLHQRALNPAAWPRQSTLLHPKMHDN